MKPLYERRYESIRPTTIIDTYNMFYEAVHNAEPQCEHLGGNRYLVNGTTQDRRWLVLEIEHLRQNLIISATSGESSFDGKKRKTVSRMLSLIACVG